MHRSVRFVLQPYKSRNPPLAAVTQARRDANSGSYGYKAVATKQPLNKGHPVPDIAHAPDQIGLLHESYPHVLAATFRFNAFFAHQAPILYYIFRPFAILHIVDFCQQISSIFMHISQIDLKSAPKGKFSTCFYLFISTNSGIYFCSKCGKCRILNNLTKIITLYLRYSLLRTY